MGYADAGELSRYQVLLGLSSLPFLPGNCCCKLPSDMYSDYETGITILSSIQLTSMPFWRICCSGWKSIRLGQNNWWDHFPSGHWLTVPAWERAGPDETGSLSILVVNHFNEKVFIGVCIFLADSVKMHLSLVDDIAAKTSLKCEFRLLRQSSAECAEAVLIFYADGRAEVSNFTLFISGLITKSEPRTDKQP